MDAIATQDDSGDRKVLQFRCQEVACRKYRESFESETEYNKHKSHHCHTFGERMTETLLSEFCFGEDLKSKQKAVRERRCYAKQCPRFNTIFSGSQSLENHLHTDYHKYHQLTIDEETDERKGLENNEQQIDEGNSDWADDGGDRLICTKKGCSRYLHVFSSTLIYNVHIKSRGHTGQERPTKKNVLQAAKRPQKLISKATSTIPRKSETATRPALISRTPTLTLTEKTLRTKNSQLENEIRNLRAELATTRDRYESRIDTLLEILQEKAVCKFEVKENLPAASDFLDM